MLNVLVSVPEQLFLPAIVIVASPAFMLFEYATSQFDESTPIKLTSFSIALPVSVSAF